MKSFDIFLTVWIEYGQLKFNLKSFVGCMHCIQGFTEKNALSKTVFKFLN